MAVSLQFHFPISHFLTSIQLSELMAPQSPNHQSHPNSFFATLPQIAIPYYQELPNWVLPFSLWSLQPIRPLSTASIYNTGKLLPISIPHSLSTLAPFSSPFIYNTSLSVKIFSSHPFTLSLKNLVL